MMDWCGAGSEVLATDCADKTGVAGGGREADLEGAVGSRGDVLNASPAREGEGVGTLQFIGGVRGSDTRNAQ